MTMLAEVSDAVIGVDTHRDTHTLQIATSAGVLIAECVIDNNTAGFAHAIAWAVKHTPGPRMYFALEGTRSYGIGLARALADAGLPVIEIVRQARDNRRRGRGKTDRIDAGLAVLAALRLTIDQLPTPRADGDREALRILLAARDELTTTRTRHINRLRALLLTGNDTDRDLARGPLNTDQLTTLTRRRGPRAETRHQHIYRTEIQRLAHTINQATQALADNHRTLKTLVTGIAPTLLKRPGIGPVSAAQAIVSFSHPGRCRNDAAFASLAGTAPIPASSGQTTRHRLNRGGDRALNRATHTIANNRMIHNPRTRDYTNKRQADGKTTAEIRRCLKRYITRELFRILTNTMT